MEYNLAYKIAEKYCELLKPFCERVEIAGSIRRKKPYVNDIEICCIPKEKLVTEGLFSEMKRDPGFINFINGIPKVKGSPERKYVRLILPEGIDMDLFITSKPQWGVIFMIRTGSAEYSRRMVTEIKPNHFVKDGFLWDVSGKIDCPEEEDFYRITGMEYFPPELRSF